LIEIHNLKSCEKDEVMRDIEIKRLLKEHSELYDGGIEHYKFKKINLRLKIGAVSIFAKPKSQYHPRSTTK